MYNDIILPHDTIGLIIPTHTWFQLPVKCWWEWREWGWHKKLILTLKTAMLASHRVITGLYCVHLLIDSLEMLCVCVCLTSEREAEAEGALTMELKAYTLGVEPFWAHHIQRGCWTDPFPAGERMGEIQTREKMKVVKLKFSWDLINHCLLSVGERARTHTRTRASVSPFKQPLFFH